MDLIDRNAAIVKLCEDCKSKYHGECPHPASRCIEYRAIKQIPKAVDVAKIQKLCNDIADAVSDIDKISVNQNVYYNCNFIMNNLKNIEKELIGIGSKGYEANGCWIICTECANTACTNRDETEAKQE